MVRRQVWDGLRKCSPGWLRRWIKNQRWFLPVSKRVFGNEVYSRSYYDDMERIEGESVQHIAAWIVEHLQSTSAFDVGCGSGLLMNALHTRGVAVQGVDLSPEAVAMTTDKDLVASVFDLTKTQHDLPVRTDMPPLDLAISCEVAEHLEPQFAETFVERLAGLAPTIFLTAAEPDPTLGPGLYHFNEQPNAYWIERFVARGYEFDEAATAQARTFLTDANVVSYLAKPMIFRAAASE